MNLLSELNIKRIALLFFTYWILKVFALSCLLFLVLYSERTTNNNAMLHNSNTMLILYQVLMADYIPFIGLAISLFLMRRHLKPLKTFLLVVLLGVLIYKYLDVFKGIQFTSIYLNLSVALVLTIVFYSIIKTCGKWFTPNIDA